MEGLWRLGGHDRDGLPPSPSIQNMNEFCGELLWEAVLGRAVESLRAGMAGVVYFAGCSHCHRGERRGLARSGGPPSLLCDSDRLVGVCVRGFLRTTPVATCSGAGHNGDKTRNRRDRSDRSGDTVNSSLPSPPWRPRRRSRFRRGPNRRWAFAFAEPRYQKRP